VEAAEVEGVVKLGLGIGWRPELALAIDRREDLGFVELQAENVDPRGPLPAPLRRLRERGVAVVVHSIGLSLGGADPVDTRRLAHLARIAEWAGAVCVSDHVCFARAGGRDSGHLLPLPRTEIALHTLCENVARARRALPVPFAVENIAALFDWPDPTMDEPELLTRLVRETGALLVLDVSNLHANARNLGIDPRAWLDRAPLDRIAYVHVGGGFARGELWHDTHAHAVPEAALALLAGLRAAAALPGAMLERDDHFPAAGEINGELDAIARAAAPGWSSLPVCAPAPRNFAPSQNPSFARRQAELVGALLAGEPIPDGFDAGRLRIESEVLLARRTRLAGRGGRRR